MAKSCNQKLKILYLMQILSEQTDEANPIMMPQILDALEANGITAERKSIYDDIETLRTIGMDIVKRSEKPVGYYVGKRKFELAELKLLVDAVQSSKFITVKKSEELIKKLEGLTSRYEARQLQRQVFVTNRIKTMNESIYYNVDRIHNAILDNVKITFQYFNWTIEKKMELRKNGDRYCISPWLLTWNDENYYLIGYDEEAETIKHYRVDKMLAIELTEEKRIGGEAFQAANAAEYAKKTFGMFHGTEKSVKIRFENSLSGVLIDRFGKDIPIRKEDETHSIARMEVAVSKQFYGWLSGLGTGIQILEPEEVKQEYIGFLQELLGQYQ